MSKPLYCQSHGYQFGAVPLRCNLCLQTDHAKLDKIEKKYLFFFVDFSFCGFDGTRILTVQSIALIAPVAFSCCCHFFF